MATTIGQQNQKLDNTTDPEALRIIGNRLSLFLSEARCVGARYTGTRQHEIELGRLREDISRFADFLRSVAADRTIGEPTQP